MKRVCLLLIPLALMSPVAMAADLDGPVYRERRTTVIEQPSIVERRIIEHHHYYEPAPRTVYVEEDYHEPRAYGYFARPWRAQWHRHHRHFRHHHWRGHRHHRW